MFSQQQYFHPGVLTEVPTYEGAYSLANQQQHQYLYPADTASAAPTALPVSPSRAQYAAPSPTHRSPVRAASPNSSIRRAQSPTSSLSYAFKSNGKNDDRAGYIRSSHQPRDLYYELPGMADDIKKSNVRGPKFATMSTNRASYITHSANGPTGLYYDLPGMATKPTSRSVDFSRGSERDGKDLLKSSNSLRPGSPAQTRSSRDLIYDLPGMAEEQRLSRKGSASFRLSSARFPSPTKSPAHHVTQRSDANTIGHDARSQTSPLKRTNSMSSSSFKMTSPRFPSPTRETSRRFQVEPYDIPGMASSVLKSPHGSASFRYTSKRDSYVKAFPQCSDLIYDIPGMSGVTYGPILSTSPGPSSSVSRVVSPTKRPPSPSRAFGQEAAAFAGPRFASPTKASAARAQQQQRGETVSND
ncbi:Hypothetical protein, putative [Bodo saltans]|uniref:Uncharacterized protein n=1 Tax=Bodo saltans TaxID=75058 RepID=A0A0S4ISW6_BODSA|nr:Hypothetical protein, putative [Bodo saltans]|eukprot:CUG06245.1 Hypothetical protein, putative [Bodo saltans]